MNTLQSLPSQPERSDSVETLATRGHATERRPLPRFRSLAGAARAFAAGLLLCTSAAVVRADAPAGLDKFAGQFNYSGTRDQGMAIVEKAFDEALSDLNMVMRLLAKKAMAQRFAEHVLIDIAGDKVGIKIGDNEKVTVGLGKTETVKSSDGKSSGKATHKFEGGKLSENLSGDTGTITNILSLSADGKTLTRDVTVTGERLKKPVKYRLVYVRK
jgi:hypothetical protein